MIYAIDIDDTVSLTSLHVLEHVNLLHKLGWSKHDMLNLLRQHRLPEYIPQLKQAKLANSIKRSLESDAYLYESPSVPNSAKFLNTIVHTHKLIYITSRIESMLPSTKQWIANNNYPAAPIIFRSITETAIDWKLRYLNQRFDSKHLVYIDDTQPMKSTTHHDTLAKYRVLMDIYGYYASNNNQGLQKMMDVWQEWPQ